ncbi:cytosolic phospholipase A2 epsilon-like [Indicator indicator]|uniref:cytosolic phospholipase A2 epsilon-like n=1 Tax=Indicator indicator TaxID=1002788 RepID=UPI0023DEEAE6|nr:cytosolic phospholipase A2 epsilon-like [Indicator indicator]
MLPIESLGSFGNVYYGEMLPIESPGSSGNKSWRGGAVTQCHKTPAQQLLTVFKDVNLFQEALATVESYTQVLLTAPAFNAAAILMASASAFSQHSSNKSSHLENEERKWMTDYIALSNVDAKQEEMSPYSLLTVRIIKLRNAHQADFLSQSDCYVSLWLPTASDEKFHTKTIKNCRNPVWNETFYFRIQRQVKNILEITVSDDDIVRDDDHAIVLFDVAKLPLGETVSTAFPLNPQKREELEVEFVLESISGPPEDIITNGAIVCREVACLEVHLDTRMKKKHRSDNELTFTVRGSFEETQRISVDYDSSSALPDSTFFHYAKYKQPSLDIALTKTRRLPAFCACVSCGARRRSIPLTLPLKSLPSEQEVVGEHRRFDLHLKVNKCQEDLDVRLGFDLCAQEKDFIRKRKKVVAAALKNILQLEEDLQEDEVPVVAIMTTGGGTRALTAMYAHLLSVQELNVLDCVSYITGLSGTTWTMSNLYEDPDWSQKDLKETLNDARKHVLKNKFLACFAPDRLKYYLKELCQREQEGHQICFTDLWGLIIETMLHEKEDSHKLTDQQQALNQGQNPLPIYLSLNVKDKISDQDFREWVEFTPYEVGFPKYGAFIRAEDFGSEFFMGRLMKKIPESRICFLEGIWSSVFSLNLMDAWYLSVNSEDFWHKWTRDKITDIDDESLFPPRPNELDTRVVCPTDSFSSIFRDVVMLRPAASEIHNFLKGFQMNNNYLESQFSKWKDCELDSQPNQLTAATDYLILIDTAFAFATSYPPLMRPERKVDVILHFNYSSGSQTVPLKEASKYFAKQGIPFPTKVPDDQETPHLKECYIVGDKESPETPIVIFFPLVNDTFREYKAPGVKRSPLEMAEGDVDVANTHGPYYINNLSYSKENFDKLVNLSYYNVQNNKDLILQALRTAVERKKQQKKEQLPTRKREMERAYPSLLIYLEVKRIEKSCLTRLLTPTALSHILPWHPTQHPSSEKHEKHLGDSVSGPELSQAFRISCQGDDIVA